jgi:hypothetical protein
MREKLRKEDLLSCMDRVEQSKSKLRLAALEVLNA